MRLCLFSILAALFFPLVAFAQPVGVDRTLRRFDFEERRLGNVEDLPMNWVKNEGPGTAHYVNGKLSNDRARSGSYSFKLELNGGSVHYRYQNNLLHVQHDAHYRVEAWVQTTVMPNARARLSAYFTDLDGRTISASVRDSDLFVSREGDTQWHRLGVELTAEDPRAVYLVIEVGLLQPQQYQQSSLGEHSLFPQDIVGAAWFDDVSISQVPQVTMTTQRPGNIFRRGDPLRLQVVVNDRFTDDLAAALVVRDAEGKIVYQKSGALDMRGAETVDSKKLMALTLPDLAAGWYEASLEMTSQGQLLGKQQLQLVLLADDGAAVAPDNRFGLIATDLPFDGWSELPQVLPYLAAGRIKLAVWSAAGDVQQANSAAFDRLLEELAERSITPTACLVALPPDLRKKVNGASWLQLLSARREDWQPQLAYMIARHANHLAYWQLGEDGSDLFVTEPKMRQVYDKIYAEFADLVQKPDLAMPWPAWYELEGKLPATVALHIKPDVLPSELPLYIRDLRAHAGHNLSIFLDPLDRNQYGREMQIRDLAQRFAYALSADAERIDVKLPLSVERDGDNVVQQPDEMFMIVRTLTSVLSGTTFKGKVPIADGVEAFLFDKNGQGILMLWDQGVSGSVKQLAVNLGQQARRVDLWGNVTPLLRSTDDAAGGNVQLSIGPMPTFLIDIDGPLAQLRASIALDNDRLESSFKPHTRKIRFINPYKQGISGMVKLSPPKGWIVNPPSFSFSMNPGEVFEKEVSLEFPYSTPAGVKTINADFLVQAESNSTFTVPINLKLGLSDVGLQTLALRDGKDLIVQQMITNYGDKPIDYTAFALYPGQARQERLVPNLLPGATTIKKYRFVNVQFQNGAKVRSGVKELDGARILNDEVEIQ
jgi:hypothetical protein